MNELTMKNCRNCCDSKVLCERRALLQQRTVKRLIVAWLVTVLLLVGSNLFWVQRDAARRDAPAPASSAACAADSGVAFGG